MFPIIFSIILATVFGLAAYITYGLEVFVESSWIDLVIVTVVLTGFIVTLMGEINDCLPCRLKTKYRHIHWLEILCMHTPCREQGLDPPTYSRENTWFVRLSQ
jgi:hypothetical protein